MGGGGFTENLTLHSGNFFPDLPLCLFMVIFVLINLTKPIFQSAVIEVRCQEHAFREIFLPSLIVLSSACSKAEDTLCFINAIEIRAVSLCSLLLSRMKCSCGLSGSQGWCCAMFYLQLPWRPLRLIFTRFLPSGDSGTWLVPCPRRQWGGEVTHRVSAVFGPSLQGANQVSRAQSPLSPTLCLLSTDLHFGCSTGAVCEQLRDGSGWIVWSHTAFPAQTRC